MCSLFFIAVALASGFFGISHAVCSPCPFKWVDNQNYCYRYFHEDLSYDEAKTFCKQFSHTGYIGEMATVSTLGELSFIMQYIVNDIFTNASYAEIPRSVWLQNTNNTDPSKCTMFVWRAGKSTELKLCGASVQQSMGSNPGRDTCAPEQDT